MPRRELGWVEEPYTYVKPTRQLALRTLKKNGTWSDHVRVFTLTDAMVFQLRNQVMPTVPSSADILFAAMHADAVGVSKLRTRVTSKVWDYPVATSIPLSRKRS